MARNKGAYTVCNIVGDDDLRLVTGQYAFDNKFEIVAIMYRSMVLGDSNTSALQAFKNAYNHERVKGQKLEERVKRLYDSYLFWHDQREAEVGEKNVWRISRER